MVLQEGETVQQFNRRIDTLGKLSPREAIRLRERAIQEGVKGTSLTLGAVSPQFISALESQRDIQNFPEKRAELQREIDLLNSSGRVATVNTSDLTRDESRQRANEIFNKQQGTTLAVNNQVINVLNSPEFQEIKERGGSQDEVNNLLNKQGVTFSRSTQAIVNELAQADIQGDATTASNIQSILSREGVTTTVTVRQDETPLGASFQVAESARPIVEPIQVILGNIPSTAGIQTFRPDEIIVGTTGTSVLGTGGSVSSGGGFGGVVSDVGSVVDEAVGQTGISPLVLGIGVIGLAILFLIVVVL